MKLTDLTTGYKGHPVTSHIDASLHAGELTCLLGPNGAGKSTLLKTMCGFLPPLEGRLLVGDTDIRRMNPSALARCISVVLTERVTVSNMTVRELVGMGRSPYTGFWGRLRNEDEAMVDQSIRLVGMEALAHRNLATLSDGERQKAMIAKALAQQTPMILLDEPTAFLDYPSKVEMMKLLCRIAHDENKTVFLSTHDLEIALQVADRLWLLDRAKGLRIGTPVSLASEGHLAAYFERPGLTFDSSTLTFSIRPAD